MKKKFAHLRKQMPTAQQERAAARTLAMIESMALADLRRARELSQETIATAMHLRQPDISKLEKRTDTYVSTLWQYVEALGGKLEIVARFPDVDVRITQFNDLAVSRA